MMSPKESQTLPSTDYIVYTVGTLSDLLHLSSRTSKAEVISTQDPAVRTCFQSPENIYKDTMKRKLVLCLPSMCGMGDASTHAREKEENGTVGRRRKGERRSSWRKEK